LDLLWADDLLLLLSTAAKGGAADRDPNKIQTLGREIRKKERKKDRKKER
jgi:hypothetical protein